jgi:hypothetical protein
MLVSDLIKAAFRKCGIYASGEAPTAQELADGLLSLQMMLRRWSSKNIAVFVSSVDSITLTASEGQYSWGEGGDITTSRPYQLLTAAFVDSSDVSHSVTIRNEHWYNRVSDKTGSGTPSDVYYRATYPIGMLYVLPVPESAGTLVSTSLKPFTETGSFSSLSDTLRFPPNYEEAILYNLVVRIATEYGKPITSEVAGLALASYNDLVTANASRLTDTVDVSGMIPAIVIRG